jgi:23S rRNA pseudouridine2457 synthase
MPTVSMHPAGFISSQVNRYFAIYKPFQVLSQFSRLEGKPTLKDFFDLPKDVYPVGRLDFDSEGLLVLTNDKGLNQLLLQPALAHEREYLVQVDGKLDTSALILLESGVQINVEGKTYLTKPCKAKKLFPPPAVPERNPPIRVRKNIPTSWISLVLTEGKNRQVRKMTAQIGYPTLRLIRYRIETLTIEGLLPGEMLEISKEDLYRKLSID